MPVNPGTDPASAADDCVEGIPEYARGCGLQAEPSAANPTCLRLTPAAFGCLNVAPTTASIPRVPEYLCGCGETNAYIGPTDPDGPLPCLSFVGNNATSGNPICGATPISATAQVLPVITNNVCGCGDGVISAAICLDNVPTTVCGPVAVCTEGSAAGCITGQICQDNTGVGGAVGTPAGDDIGDACAAP
jgi:hypothetical protein